MRALSLLTVGLALVFAAVPPAFAQDRTRTKEIVVGLGAEPRTCSR